LGCRWLPPWGAPPGYFLGVKSCGDEVSGWTFGSLVSVDSCTINGHGVIAVGAVGFLLVDLGANCARLSTSCFIGSNVELRE
jgi:hypothetical protein